MDINFKPDSLSPELRSLIEAAVQVTPVLRSRHGRRLALLEEKKPESDFQKDK